jgi:hypothetical protein
VNLPKIDSNYKSEEIRFAQGDFYLSLGLLSLAEIPAKI